MRCPFCATDEDKVIETRVSKDGSEIRRRRECEGCKRRFTTYERIEESMPLVIKSDGRREPFDRNKIEHGIAGVGRQAPGLARAGLASSRSRSSARSASSASARSRRARSASACCRSCARSIRSRTCGSRRSIATSATSRASRRRSTRSAARTPAGTACRRCRRSTSRVRRDDRRARPRPRASAGGCATRAPAADAAIDACTCVARSSSRSSIAVARRRIRSSAA